jgi:hypothetical protein
MKLTVSNSNISNNLSTAKLTLANGIISDNLTIGNVLVTPSQISIGSVSITPTAVSVPSLVLGGTPFSGGLQGGIINYQEFTANGTWDNPLIYQQVNVSQGLTYTYYTQGSVTSPITEAGLDALFNTATSSPTVTFGGTGIHSGTINWGDATSTSGAGGTPGTKPAYLPADQFSWIVEGYILAPETGTYTFGVDGDDACDVHVNGTRVAHFYDSHGFAGVWSGNPTYPQQTTGTISLLAGNYYTFRARMQEGAGGDGIQVGWRKPSDGSIALIPASAFYYGTVTNTLNTSLTGYEQVLVMAWGAGGGSNGGYGGGGGACVIGQLSLSSMANACAVTIGTSAAGVVGGSSTLVVNSASTITAYGGGAANTSTAGGGGGSLSAGALFAGGSPLGGGGTGTSTQLVSTFGGAGVNTTVATVPYGSIFGGGAGVIVASGGGGSIFGGGGGSNSTALGVSIFGGNGGNNTIAANTPAGGAGGTSKAGARGEIRVWVFGPASLTI